MFAVAMSNLGSVHCAKYFDEYHEVYVPVNSKTAHPPRAIPGYLTRVKLRTVGNLTQNEARPMGHLTLNYYATQPQKPHRESVRPVFALCHEKDCTLWRREYCK